jgi:hypothetical protein
VNNFAASSLMLYNFSIAIIAASLYINYIALPIDSLIQALITNILVSANF